MGDIGTLKRHFGQLLDEVQPWVLSHFVMWLDIKVAEYKVLGHMILDNTANDTPQWLRNPKHGIVYTEKNASEESQSNKSLQQPESAWTIHEKEVSKQVNTDLSPRSDVGRRQVTPISSPQESQSRRKSDSYSTVNTESVSAGGGKIPPISTLCKTRHNIDMQSHSVLNFQDRLQNIQVSQRHDPFNIPKSSEMVQMSPQMTEGSQGLIGQGQRVSAISMFPFLSLDSVQVSQPTDLLGHLTMQEKARLSRSYQSEVIKEKSYPFLLEKDSVSQARGASTSAETVKETEGNPVQPFVKIEISSDDDSSNTTHSSQNMSALNLLSTVSQQRDSEISPNLEVSGDVPMSDVNGLLSIAQVSDSHSAYPVSLFTAASSSTLPTPSVDKSMRKMRRQLLETMRNSNPKFYSRQIQEMIPFPEKFPIADIKFGPKAEEMIQTGEITRAGKIQLVDTIFHELIRYTGLYPTPTQKMAVANAIVETFPTLAAKMKGDHISAADAWYVILCDKFRNERRGIGSGMETPRRRPSAQGKLMKQPSQSPRPLVPKIEESQQWLSGTSYQGEVTSPASESGSQGNLDSPQNDVVQYSSDEDAVMENYSSKFDPVCKAQSSYPEPTLQRWPEKKTISIRGGKFVNIKQKRRKQGFETPEHRMYKLLKFTEKVKMRFPGVTVLDEKTLLCCCGVKVKLGRFRMLHNYTNYHLTRCRNPPPSPSMAFFSSGFGASELLQLTQNRDSMIMYDIADTKELGEIQKKPDAYTETKEEENSDLQVTSHERSGITANDTTSTSNVQSVRHGINISDSACNTAVVSSVATSCSENLISKNALVDNSVSSANCDSKEDLVPSETGVLNLVVENREKSLTGREDHHKSVTSESGETEV
ncbi:hypothetical protein CHS0354_043182 [Potamilus streckersoni]|uniref:Uncharacterized protein n=1 Tax=Potamilus streckersoni TaxID=2493646 RepID=A0AAE0VZM3_9BIVA|nr:hypothetical protein CHS0354_043182 [Potamilus streckersoni]